MHTDPRHPVSKEPTRPALVREATPTSSRVCIDCGDFGLLVPASDLVSIAAPQQLTRRAGDSPEVCGSVTFQEKVYVIVCLNNALQLQPEMDESQTTLALLRHENYHFGIACRALTKSETELSNRYNVPPSMSSRRQPFTEFVVIDNRAWGLSSAAALLGLLKLRGVRLRPQDAASPTIRRGVSI